MNPPPTRFVVPDTTKRDAFIAGFVGLLVLIFVGYGVVHMSQPVTGNKLTGTVIEKIFTPQKEQQIEFSGRKIKAVKEIAGEYVLKVRVEPDKRIYEVPVEQPVYDSKKVGDELTFMRPPSEQH
jgi:hypothetical protein